MKKISIYFTDCDSLETALNEAERNGYRLIENEAGSYDYLRPIKSANGAVLGWIVVYTDEHNCAKDLMCEEFAEYFES